jgi:hypothetical protein
MGEDAGGRSGGVHVSLVKNASGLDIWKHEDRGRSKDRQSDSALNDLRQCPLVLLVKLHWRDELRYE